MSSVILRAAACPARGTALALLALLAGPARAETTLVAEVPVAIALSEAHRGVFGIGAMPAGGLYVGTTHVALGLRMRAGVLRDGAAPGDNLVDPGLGGLVTASLAARVRHAGAWFELVAGRGFTGADAVPTLEVGIGYGVAIASYDIGPSARYVRVIAPDAPMTSRGTAELLLLGFDVRWGAPRRPAAPRPAPPVIAVAPAAPEEPPAAAPTRAPTIEPLPDRVIDLDASCAQVPEGCPFGEGVQVETDRLVLDDRVLFDVDRARVRHSGREVVRSIAQVWKAHPEWVRIRIEGHTDARGREDYNLALSQKRAERVRDQLIRSGADPARIEAVGMGQRAPRDPGSTERAHERNRRVEFVIFQEGAR